MSGIFREKSIDRISQPEQLENYVKVPTPYTWWILLAVIIFLCGLLFWGFTGSIDTEVSCMVKAENGRLTGFISESEAGDLKSGSAVIVKNTKYSISEVSSELSSASDVQKSYDGQLEAVAGDNSDDGYFYEFSAECGGLADGVYRAYVITESMCPAEFVFN